MVLSCECDIDCGEGQNYQVVDSEKKGT